MFMCAAVGDMRERPLWLFAFLKSKFYWFLPEKENTDLKRFIFQPPKEMIGNCHTPDLSTNTCLKSQVSLEKFSIWYKYGCPHLTLYKPVQTQ